MNIRLESLDQKFSFNLERNNVPDQEAHFERQKDHMEQHVDVEKLETLICLESLLVTCYQTLGWLVHNRTIRRECLQLEQQAQCRQEELKKIFPLSQKSEIAIESKVNHYLLQLRPTYLSLMEIINLIINFTVFKIDIYKYFSCDVQRHHDLLNSFFQENVEEKYFLEQERIFHQNRLNSYLKV